MAETFGVDAVAAGDASQQLKAIRATMNGLNDIFDGHRGASGSGRIEEALGTFFKESSDSREAADGLLERAAGLLEGLSRGATELDTALGDAVSGKGSENSGGAGGTVPAQRQAY
jgi:hypothetical protein